MSNADPIHRFRALMQCPDDQVNLAEAALLIAATEYPSLDAQAELAHLDRMASRLKTDPAAPALRNIQALNQLLFEEESFSGNEEEYDDPRNSFLNDVLACKKGIPITLSIVYLEVAGRRHLPVAGVGFPGHFLVKYLDASAGILIDPYHRGTILTPEDCARLLHTHFGSEAELKPDYFRTSTSKQILARVLNNLKGSYFQRGNYVRVLAMVEMALSIDGGTHEDLRDRGMVHFLLKNYSQALADLKAYLQMQPDGEDEQVKNALQTLHRILASMN